MRRTPAQHRAVQAARRQAKDTRARALELGYRVDSRKHPDVREAEMAKLVAEHPDTKAAEAKKAEARAKAEAAEKDAEAKRAAEAAAKAKARADAKKATSKK